MLAILCMWMGISVPLVFLGYFFGFRKEVIIALFYCFHVIATICSVQD